MHLEKDILSGKFGKNKELKKEAREEIKEMNQKTEYEHAYNRKTGVSHLTGKHRKAKSAAFEKKKGGKGKLPYGEISVQGSKPIKMMLS